MYKYTDEMKRRFSKRNLYTKIVTTLMKDFLFILWCFYSTVSYSQNEEINNILTSKGDIKLPTSVPKLNSAFGVNPNIEEDEYSW
ncbi:MAG: hypothetical protein IPP02_13985 [Chitinophagaceae bacterium]|nr:hypothetical protein [Chitinophagaceae bacterium]